MAIGGAEESRRELPPALLLVSVLAVAICLRPAITAVGPVLPLIGRDDGLGESALGVLGALPLLAFAVVSPFVSRLAARTGAERLVFAALCGLAAGTLVRSYAGEAGLWVGTFIVGAGIAIGNVLVPVFVRRDFPGRVSEATGLYSAFLAMAAGIAAAIAAPIAAAQDWRFALVVWGGVALLAAAVWSMRLRSRSAGAAPVPEPDATPPVAVWRQPMAWVLTAFMGLQSTIFYIMVNWLPSIELARSDVSLTTAGVHLFIYQVIGTLAGLAVPLLMRGRVHQRTAAVAAAVPVVVGVTGLLMFPQIALVWAIFIGGGSGASLVVALTLIGLRGRSHRETASLSGMVQSLGYLLAAIGPAAAGTLAEATGGWTATLVFVLVLGCLQVLAGFVAGTAPAE